MNQEPTASSTLSVRLRAAALLCLFAAGPLSGTAALPDPLVDIDFDGDTAPEIANEGSLGGSGTFAVADAFPELSANVPSGTFAPAENTTSVEFGTIAAGQGSRAIDFFTGADGTLGPLNEFTVTGWLNSRDLRVGSGGNRITFALESPNGAGFDLVQMNDGSLQLGVNQWPDNTPARSPGGWITQDPEAGADNWVFFAVTYDPAQTSGQVKYYFGSPEDLVALVSEHTYARGVIATSGLLTLGNFGSVVTARTATGPTGSRVFRGLMDEIKIWDQALSLEEIQSAQLNGAAVPVEPVVINQQPLSQTAFEGQSLTLRVGVEGTAPFTFQWQRDGGDIPGATEPTYTIDPVTAAEEGASFRVIVTNAAGSETSDAAVLSVRGPHKVAVSFSEAGPVINRGTLEGTGTIVQRNDYPRLSEKVPAGSAVPSDNIASMDFGPIEAGQGGRAIDFSNQFGNTLGQFNSFTISGWLNAYALEDGPGGNRIAFALAAANGPGFDLVQLDSGALRLGVNEWPDNGATGGGPPSSAGWITADPEGGNANWVFFAVTYDSTLEFGNVSYYFGAPDMPAQLDIGAQDYNRGPITQSGRLTLGNFGSIITARNASGPDSRVFRGLMDEINIIGRALSAEEILELQTGAAFQPVPPEAVEFTQHPQSVTTFAGQTVSFSSAFTGTPHFTYQWQKNGENIPGATGRTLDVPATLADEGAEYRVVVTNPAGSFTSSPAILSVEEDTGLRVEFSFSEGSGASTANTGDLLGVGQFVQQDAFPAFSATVPTGTYVPAGNESSVDFGTIAAGQGNRAIDLNTPFGNTIGGMSQFTITGWLNSRDLRTGGGGNRVLFALAGTPGPGLDLVQLNDGSLQLGVNAFPDGSPARSSAGWITEDSNAGNANWVFFAITYDGTAEFGHAQFYFGTTELPAVGDFGAIDYPQGPINQSGPLTIGNFGSAVGARTATGPTASRVFRGLMDEIRIHTEVLTLEEIQAVQQAAAAEPPAQAPEITASLSGANLVLEWETSGAFTLEAADSLTDPQWSDAGVTPTQNGSTWTATIPTSGSARFFRLSNN